MGKKSKITAHYEMNPGTSTDKFVLGAIIVLEYDLGPFYRCIKFF